MKSKILSAPATRLLLAWLLAGCADIVHSEEGPVDSIVVEPAEPVLQEGAEIQLKARLFNASGTELEGRAVFWASEDPEVATLSDSGVLRGVARGTTRVAASAEGKHALTEVRVVPIPVGAVSVSPSSVRIGVEESETLQVVVRDERGTVVTDREVTWSSSSTAVAVVNGSGVVTGVRPGRATISAVAEGVSGSADVRVTSGPPAEIDIVSGNAQQSETGRTLPELLVVRLTDAQQNPVPDVAVTWEADHGTVTPTDDRTDENGEASASWKLGSSTGEQRATASVGTLNVRFTASAAARTVARVEVSPGSVTLIPLATQRLEATALDDDENELSGRSVTWESSAPRVATVSSSGLVRALRPGQAVITATIDGVAGTSSVRVNQGQASSLEVVSGNGQEAITGTELRDPLVVRVTDEQGNTVPEVEVQWSAAHGSVSPTSASTGPTGEASTRWTLGNTVGEQRASVSVGDLTAAFTAVGSAPIEAAVASIAVSPATAVIPVQDTQQFEAIARDQDGVVLTGRSVSWTSSAPSVAEVDENGLASAKNVGTAEIRASIDGIRGSAEVVVVPGPPTSITTVSGDGQAGVKSTTLPEPIVLRITDTLGNGVPEVEVEWSANRGGSITPSSTKTDSDGRAAAEWKLGEPVGEHRATARAGPLSVTFTATSLPPAQGDEEPEEPNAGSD
jgi:trimeric autotransporter adhesin